AEGAFVAVGVVQAVEQYAAIVVREGQHAAARLDDVSQRHRTVGGQVVVQGRDAAVGSVDLRQQAVRVLVGARQAMRVRHRGQQARYIECPRDLVFGRVDVAAAG